MKTETPRTDALISDKETFCFDATDLEPAMKLVEHARQLERELNEAVEWRDKWKACVEQAALVHDEIGRVIGVKCSPHQMPRFVAERLAAVSNAKSSDLREQPKT